MTDRRRERSAVDLAAAGFHLFPCRPRGKAPLTRRGFHEATRDERQLLQWWERWPDANIGVACGASGIAVLDVDSKHGADPREVIPQLGLDGYPVVWTGEAPERGEEYPDSLPGLRGAQVYLRASLPTGKVTIPGVEIRGEGAYVIAPPSLHPCGVAYEGEPPAVAQLPSPPPAVLALAVAVTAERVQVEDGMVFDSGERHERLLAWARSRYTARGVLGEAALMGMLGKNLKACRPPLPEDEVRRLWRHLERTRIAGRERQVAQLIAGWMENR